MNILVCDEFEINSDEKRGLSWNGVVEADELVCCP